MVVSKAKAYGRIEDVTDDGTEDVADDGMENVADDGTEDVVQLRD